MPRGMTLAELLVVLVLLGVLAGLAGVTLTSLRPPPAATALTALREARANALRSGRATTWSDGARTIRFHPDGSATGGPVTVDGVTVAVDPLTGGLRAR